MTKTRPLSAEKMKQSIRVCSDMIRTFNPGDEVLTFPQVNGSVKVVAVSGCFTFFVLADGTIQPQ